jgi:uncharacterized iron-regulated protein
MLRAMTHTPWGWRRAACGLAATLLLAACASTPDWPALPLLVFGEQHDQPDQQRQVADAVKALAGQQRLAAVVIEMAERGRSTAGLTADADEAQVRAALAWTGWPWPVYAGVVMNAVRAGVPVRGGNLPRAETRATMGDASFDARADDSVKALLTRAVREGHCGLLPPAQEPGMVRVQLARDLSMAATVREALAEAGPGRSVLLLTGAQHAARDRGVPWHLVRQGTLPPEGMRVVTFGRAARAAGLGVDEERRADFTPRPDPCEGLAERLAPAAK